MTPRLVFGIIHAVSALLRTSTFVDVSVDAHDALPDGILLRFKAVSDPRALSRILYAPEVGPEVWCMIEGRDGNGARCEAMAVQVEDSSAGVSTLVFGGARGLRLMPSDGAFTFAETHLLVSAECLP